MLGDRQDLCELCDVASHNKEENWRSDASARFLVQSRLRNGLGEGAVSKYAAPNTRKTKQESYTMADHFLKYTPPLNSSSNRAKATCPTDGNARGLASCRLFSTANNRPNRALLKSNRKTSSNCGICNASCVEMTVSKASIEGMIWW